MSRKIRLAMFPFRLIKMACVLAECPWGVPINNHLSSYLSTHTTDHCIRQMCCTKMSLIILFDICIFNHYVNFFQFKPFFYFIQIWYILRYLSQNCKITWNSMLFSRSFFLNRVFISVHVFHIVTFQKSWGPLYLHFSSGNLLIIPLNTANDKTNNYGAIKKVLI